MVAIAHRGGAAYAPENTFAAFDLALAMGLDWVETDLRLSKDGTIMLIHDAKVDRTTDGQGPVREKTCKDLQRLDAGAWFGEEFAGQRIPTLEEFFLRYRSIPRVMLEIKDAGMLEDKLARLIATHERYDQAVVVGSDRTSLLAIQEHDPRVSVGWTALQPTEENIELALQMGCHHIGILPEHLTPQLVSRIKQRGIQVRSTNVKDEKTMRHAADCGVMGMTINFPKKLLAYMNR
jgi:glycerophosphoryl diester phosphodiesterase